MRKIRLLLLVGLMLTGMFVAVAQTELSAWPFYVETTVTSNRGLYELTVPLHVIGHARDDLADLRLFDSQNHEIPYAILIRKEVEDQREFDSHVFNEVTVGSATEATVDLGANQGEHNEVQIDTDGNNFRRRVTVEGSDTRSEWRTLKSEAVIFSFGGGEQKAVQSNHVTYPTSRYRYLRVRVSRDELSDDHQPHVTNLKVFLVVQEKGELTSWPVPVPSYQLLRNQGAHATSWAIDFGSRLACDRLQLTIDDPSFYRPFQVENIDDPQNPQLIAIGNLSRRTGEVSGPTVITFDNEVHAQKLRLQITDYSNQPLTIAAIQASAPARELYFDLKQPQALPLRIYFGNSKITEPHYDFEKELSAQLKNPVMQTAVGDSRNNPAYTPERLPFTERAPWLIYLVLLAASSALGWILLSLTRTTLRSGTTQKRDAA